MAHRVHVGPIAWPGHGIAGNPGNEDNCADRGEAEKAGVPQEVMLSAL